MPSSVYDTSTAFLIAGLVFSIMPVIVWITLIGAKSRAVLWWCIGSFTLGLGLIAITFRATSPELMPFHTSFTLVVVGYVLHLHALRMEQRQFTSLWLWLAVALFSVGAKEFFFRLDPNDGRHFLVGYIVHALALIGIGICVQKIAGSEKSTSIQWLRFINYFGAVLFIGRFISGISGHANPDILLRGLPGVLTTALVVFIGIINNVSIIGLYLERSQKKNIQLIAEQEQARSAAELTIKMAAMDRQRSMGELAAGLAHELSQPVTGILLNSSTLTEELTKRGSTFDDLANISQDITLQATRERQVLEGIRNFIKPQATTLAAVDLVEVMTGVQNILAPVMQKRGGVVCVHSDASRPRVKGDVIQLSQIFLNLFRNALQAKHPERALRIEVTIDSDQTGQQVVIEDNGIGMSDEQLLQHGSPFVITKDEGMGMGMGLAICKRIVEHHGGTICVTHATSGNGLKTILRFPLADSSWA